ncbi:hypothetical protein GFY24_11630 [Nocardia sp. SYP-A9097]|uniref:hypothetical protein n=1 Tax=Nocardia sp. SYP-A9097 TaxID=2663237 RepID=UPI00129ABD6C|nr:hypothetical protein [Nocardia sp. SYP-A9097]MRH88085.1 hypothetical protein [Nocardia sp. SYP-A9097]
MREQENFMSVSRAGLLLAEGVAVVSVFFAAAGGGATRTELVADGLETGSALSPTGIATGSVDGGPQKCVTSGSAISLSGESGLTCKGGIFSGSA